MSNPAMIPFRNTAGEVQYTSAPTSNSSLHTTPRQAGFRVPDQQYDSDAEPLLQSAIRSNNFNDLTEEEKARFTATGRPIQASRAAPQAWGGGQMFMAPHTLPKQYTDESIIPAIVTNVIAAKPVASQPKDEKRRKSFSSIFKGEKKTDDLSKGITKVVFMPRGEYLKYFAKDDNGVYAGTEPQRQWSEEELDKQFGHYRPTNYQNKGKMNAGTIDRMTYAWTRAQT